MIVMKEYFFRLRILFMAANVLLRVRRLFLHASVVSFITLCFTCHRHAHLIHLNYLIIVQEGDIFPASKVGGGGGNYEEWEYKQ